MTFLTVFFYSLLPKSKSDFFLICLVIELYKKIKGLNIFFF